MVSNHIQALEERLGARLLNRTTRKISLTEVGTGYYERCALILAELEAADSAAGALQTAPKGTLRVYTSSHILRFVAPIVSEYMGLYPEVRIEVAMGERMIDLVEERIDVAIRTTPVPDSSLVARKLIDWRHILCASPAYLARDGEPKDIAELARRNCLRYALYPFGDEWRFTGPEGKPATVKIGGNLVSASAEIMRAAALDGRGIVLAPDFYIFEDVARTRLAPILKQYKPHGFALNAIYVNRQNVPAKVRAFLDLLVARMAEHWAVIGRTLGA